jgi:PilZ domain-containing protein
MNEEKRRYRRIPFECPVVLTTIRGDVYHGSVTDISIHGLRAKLDTKDDLEGRAISFRIELSEGDPPFVIEADGEVVRQTADGYVGVYVVKTDIDSLSHLRRLLELNMSEPESAKSELDKW